MKEMRKKSVVLGMLMVGIVIGNGCQNRKTPLPQEEQEDIVPQTQITLIGDDAEFNIGQVVNDPNNLNGKEWLILNAGQVALKVDSVVPSCDCVEVKYKESMTAAPHNYFPIRVILHPNGETGPFFREIKVYGNFPDSPLLLTIEGEFKNKN